MTPSDPLPQIIADRITGLTRTNGGPFLRFDAQPSKDGREIHVTTTRYDFTSIGDRAVRVVLHVSPQMPLADEPECPNGVGTMDVEQPPDEAA